MAFVVVTHLHPEHESHMAELLQKHTAMPTAQVTERVRVERNHVYVIPPNRSIRMADAHVEPVEFEEPHGRRTPIDHFFRSLASGHTESIAVILSGGGTDGSVGVKDIKEQGGLILVQHPEDAEYDSMPRAAINTGLADVVLPAAQLAEKLGDYVRHLPQLPHDPDQLNEQDMETLQRILAQVQARTGHDFNQYKRTTVLRRVQRRMQINGFATLEAYLGFLRHDAGEARAMFNDILIGVTNFFRDRESWEALTEQVIPALFRARDQTDEVRVWSIGCATGEEAYSLAILLLEQAAKVDFRPRIQVFASDLDEGAITHAREGLYPAAIEADVSAERLERFFIREGEYYRVKRELRDMVLFANHNMLRDPPFARQDLIACRNVLIYLQRAIQDRVFNIFHYALQPDGYLFLGSSESAEHLPDFFDIIDKHNRIYQARLWEGERPHVPMLPLNIRRERRPAEATGIGRMGPGHYEESPVLEGGHRRALEAYGPPSVIVNERYAILHLSETAGRFLIHPKGPITGDLLRLARPELQVELRTALFQAFDRQRSVISRPVPVKFNGDPRAVVISVRPGSGYGDPDPSGDRQALVFFLEDEVNSPEAAAVFATPPGEMDRDEFVHQLEVEVQRLREQLQVTLEEYDSSSEEMKAANEELQSINEEYRSATEELETSKEELQSVNEELQTVNSEMRGKLEEISRAHQELGNLMGATEIPTLYLDRELRIQRYTAGIQELFNIMPLDRGRPISHLTQRLGGYDHLMADAEEVMRRLIPAEREVQLTSAAQGQMEGSYLVRLRPYRTEEDRIEGVVVTFIDITKLKEAQRELERAKESLEERVLERTRELDEANRKVSAARDMFEGLFEANPVPTALTRLDDEVFINVNKVFLDYIGLKERDVLGHSANEFGLGLGLASPQRASLVETLEGEGTLRGYEAEIRHPSGDKRNILASFQQIKLDQEDALISTFIDITDRVRAERKIRTLASRLTEAEQQERLRISHILHDDLQQRLFAIKSQLSLLTVDRAVQNGEAFQKELAAVEADLAETIAVTRDLSVDLSPIVLQGEGLAEALTWLSTRMRDQHNLEVLVETNGVPTTFEPSVRVLLFQAVRELLFNVVKHAGVSQARVHFEHFDKRIRILVGDTGNGFDAEALFDGPISSHGLPSLRQRLELMGCGLTIASQPGKGTEAYIDCPEERLVK
jgi:two-component system CheB/CheR fusion protein